MAQLRIEVDGKVVDVKGPPSRLRELTDSLSLVVATAGGATGPALAVSGLPATTPVWMTGALIGAQLVFLTYVVTMITLRGRR